MDSYLIDRFSDDLEVIEFHKSFIEKFGFKKPEIDYVKLYKFIRNSVNFLKDIDPDFMDSLGKKMYEDINSLFQFKKEWENKTFSKYFYEYLNSLEEYKTKKEEYEKLKLQIKSINEVISLTEKQLKSFPKKTPKNKIEEYKKIKKQNVDAIYEYSIVKEKFRKLGEELEKIEKEKEKIFKKSFEEIKCYILKELDDIINVKLFYFTKLYWNLANDSYLLQKYAQNSDVELSMKSMMKYFLKNIDFSKKINNDEIEYMQKVLKDI